MSLKSKLVRFVAPLLYISGCAILSPAALADTVEEDSLNPRKGLRWAGNGLQFDKVLTIQDPLVSAPVGKVTITRDGSDTGFLIKDPFLGPNLGQQYQGTRTHPN
jgi:hypothetical protein